MDKKEIIKEFGRNEKDTGSTEVQVAILTNRIRLLTEHLKKHPKDNSSKRGILKLVSKRKELMKYLKRKDFERYKSVVQRLNLRG